MSRQSILPLPDSQVAILVRTVPPLLDAYPAGGTSHRSFVREFIRVVHAATGRTFNPAIYRKLLAIHASGRRPSTDTLAKEKKAFDAALAEEADAGRQINSETGHELASVVQRAVDTALARHRPARIEEAGSDRYVQAQLDFLQTRLGETERMLSEVRAQAARYAGDLKVAQVVRETLQAQIETANALALAQTQRIEQLIFEIAGMRKFAMNAIESSRGETRVQKERAVHLEGLLKTEKEHTEVFRRLAYRAGAAIPSALQPDGKL